MFTNESKLLIIIMLKWGVQQSITVCYLFVLATFFWTSGGVLGFFNFSDLGTKC